MNPPARSPRCRRLQSRTSESSGAQVDHRRDQDWSNESLPVLGLGSLAAGAAELIPFRVGEATPANTFLAIWMAQAAGFYEAAQQLPAVDGWMRRRAAVQP
jgi:hypothetical protein